jgi:predicted metal-dependent enzyme (double-stranded beta helix superfamily)
VAGPPPAEYRVTGSNGDGDAIGRKRSLKAPVVDAVHVMVATDTLAEFVDDVRDVFEATDSPTEQAERVAGLTAELTTSHGWLEEELGDGRVRQAELYVDDDHGHPEPGFRITAGRSEPGKESARSHLAHDHGLAWVVYATCSGQREQNTFGWTYDDAGIPHLERTGNVVLEAGDVIAVPPGGIHQQRTVGDEPSLNLRIESQDMSVRPRHWYNLDDEAAEASVEPTVA